MGLSRRGGKKLAGAEVPALLPEDAGKVLSWDGTQWEKVAPAAGSVRGAATLTTPSLANNAAHAGELTLAPTFAVFRVATDRAARVRLYVSPAHRTADAARPATADPTGDHGLLLEVVTTAAKLAVPIAPAVVGSLLAGGTAAPLAVTNLSGAAGAVAVTVNWVPLEA